MGECIEVVREGAVARVWLSRPDVHNALNGQLMSELVGALRELAADDGARVVVLGGRGRSFCAGADLAWMRQTALSGGANNAEDARVLASLFESIDAFPKPVVGRIHGSAMGGGAGIVACCDIPIAAARARFGFTEVRLGMAPAVISPFVVGRIGKPAARELFLTGARFDAARACALGLVNRVEPDDEALDRAVDETVAALLMGAPKAQAACKELARTITDQPIEVARETTARLIASLRAAPEGQEGMRAFLERRPPAWQPAAGEGDGEG
ncbi:MAG: enoyl-CoA hydratase/isomerase family protein [Deltaproteobacteria bacterium]|nr:enoyl-CoA hydratase/isomerase family protein [Deltaproteobacteria bacterium]MCB9786491.1 enoyl-CoA hydratase/isomerase family protein [Deltaproteobacteria bacterium]